MPRDNCSICTNDHRENLERLGLEALQERRSWRSITTETDLTHTAGLRNHMEKHFTHSLVERAKQEQGDALAGFLKEALSELTMAMAVAPTETKPLYAMMIHNLSSLEKTQPSQQSLIAAAKAIHEITGMKMQQRLLLNYAEAFQGALPAPKKELEPPIEDAEVVDV